MFVYDLITLAHWVGSAQQTYLHDLTPVLNAIDGVERWWFSDWRACPTQHRRDLTPVHPLLLLAVIQLARLYRHPARAHLREEQVGYYSWVRNLVGYTVSLLDSSPDARLRHAAMMLLAARAEQPTVKLSFVAKP